MYGTGTYLTVNHGISDCPIFTVTTLPFVHCLIFHFFSSCLRSARTPWRPASRPKAANRTTSPFSSPPSAYSRHPGQLVVMAVTRDSIRSGDTHVPTPGPPAQSRDPGRLRQSTYLPTAPLPTTATTCLQLGFLDSRSPRLVE